MADQITTASSLRWSREEQAEHRRQWVEALRSGEFKQGRTALRQKNFKNEDVYCCLGVACELAARAGVIPEASPLQEGLYYYKANAGFLPPEVQDWLGLSWRSGMTRDGDFLTNLNDNVGLTFDQIADLIERDGVLLVGESR